MSASSQKHLPVIAITGGEPAGIATEVILKALMAPLTARVVVIADADWLASITKKMALDITIRRVTDTDQVPPHQPGQLSVMHCPVIERPQLGMLNSANAQYVLTLLAQAHELAISGQVDAIVTAPVHKGVINDAGTPFSGHTEFFADACKVSQVVMMLASDIMKVALATTHMPIKQVATSLTRQRLTQILNICLAGLRQLGIKQPSIAVLGLNPHAGEQGHLGSEELEVINPTIEQFQADGEKVAGALPADTAFNKTNLAATDLFLAMFHDQGLPVIKYASFGQCANVTLGLPYIRTSVDHGTALDIAEQFIASESSMSYALKFACEAVLNRIELNHGNSYPTT